jgi:Xaa-Pro aminopeptidase
MEARGVDLLVTAPARSAGGRQVESAYVAGAGSLRKRLVCLIPRVGAPVALVDGPEETPRVGWITDVRCEQRRLASATVDAIRAFGSIYAVAVTGCAPIPPGSEDLPPAVSTRNAFADGAVPHQFWTTLQSALPDVEWRDLTTDLRALRAVKAAEEGALLAQAATLADAALERAAQRAHAGTPELDVWAALVADLASGGESPTAVRWGSGLRPQLLDRPTHSELQRGSIISAEPEASVHGYRVQPHQAIAVGACDAVFRDLSAANAEYWQTCFDLFQPGRPLSEIVNEADALARQIATRPGRYDKVKGAIALRGCGLGDDAPTYSARLGPEAPVRRDSIKAGWIFVLETSLGFDLGFRLLSASWGGAVHITPGGPVRLGVRTIGLHTTP